MDAPAQTALPLEDPQRCRTCGREWPGLLDGAGADLGAFMELPPDEREAFSRCWTGQCTKRGA